MKSSALGAAQGLIAGETIRRGRADADRSDEYLGIQKENHAVGMERAGREREESAAGKEGLPAFIYGAVSGQDPAEVLSSFNQFGSLRIQDYTMNPDNSISLTRADGQTASIPANTVNGFMKKYRGLNIAGTSTSTRPGPYKQASYLKGLGQFFDISGLDTSQKNAVAQGVEMGLDFKQIGEQIGLEPIVNIASMDLKDVDAEIAKHTAEINAGDDRYGLANVKSRKKKLAKLQVKREKLLKEVPPGPAGVTMTAQGLNIPTAPINQAGDTVGGISGRLPKIMDKDGDNKLDQDYTVALRVVDLMKNPEAAKRLMARFGAIELTRFEEMAKAVRKQLGQSAQKRVQSELPGVTSSANRQQLDSLTTQLNH